MNNSGIKIGKYKHYKGDVVEVIGKALQSETHEEFVIYKHVTGKRTGEPYFWARPLKMFVEYVDLGEKKVPRFEYIGE